MVVFSVFPEGKYSSLERLRSFPRSVPLFLPSRWQVKEWGVRGGTERKKGKLGKEKKVKGEGGR